MIKHFNIRELVPRHIYNLRGEEAWGLLDYTALKTLEWLRENLGACTVNNWNSGGRKEQSGLRTFEYYIRDKNMTKPQAMEAIGLSNSQHKYGRAFDCTFSNCNAEQVRHWIKEHWCESGFDWAITLEENVSWVHFDTRNQPENKVYLFKP